ncbi:MAG: hypothetical protein HY791_01710 [Deltaproteobacteria bacterium]|nr:hypothetical protein [Deltaproteobacteria bacterium]
MAHAGAAALRLARALWWGWTVGLPLWWLWYAGLVSLAQTTVDLLF